jgi:hypothetical protein
MPFNFRPILREDAVRVLQLRQHLERTLPLNMPFALTPVTARARTYYRSRRSKPSIICREILVIARLLLNRFAASGFDAREQSGLGWRFLI